MSESGGGLLRFYTMDWRYYSAASNKGITCGGENHGLFDSTGAESAQASTRSNEGIRKWMTGLVQLCLTRHC